MKVFITGASGYIGSNVAQAFRRAGHEVWGLVRDEKKAWMLRENEIHPVIGRMEEPGSYSGPAGGCQVLVHAALQVHGDTVGLDNMTVDSLLSLSGTGPFPKTLIYTSGCWVYGNTKGEIADETSALSPPSLVAWRPAVERKALGTSGTRGIVIRPGCAYGRQERLFGIWMSDAQKGDHLSVIGDGVNRWCAVHVDDLADGYLRAAESGLPGEIFNLADPSRQRVSEMVEAIACAADYKKDIRYVPVGEAERQLGPFAECLALDQHVDSRKAETLLGCRPRHTGFADEAEIFFEAWKAHAAKAESPVGV